MTTARRGTSTRRPRSDAPANTGLSPYSPLASIQAVLNAFDLGPGDVIFVDTGSYQSPPTL